MNLPTPLRILQLADRVKKRIDILAAVSFALLLVSLAAERAGVPRFAFQSRLEFVIGCLGFALLAFTLFVRVALIRSPAEGVARASTADAKGEKLRRLIRGWMAPNSTVHREWRYPRDQTDFDALFKLNYEGFRNSHFSIDMDTLSKRNLAFVRKNPKVFALIHDPVIEGRVIGYSCVLPLTAEALELYLAGRIEDRDLRAMHLSSPEEEAAGLVVFAIVLDEQCTRHWQRCDNPYLATFFAAIADHLRDILHDGSREVRIYAQTEKNSIGKLLDALDFEGGAGVSAEGFEFYSVSSRMLIPREPALSAETA